MCDPPRAAVVAPRGRAIDWLRLVRISNHGTVIADVAAGFLVAAGLRGEIAWPPPALWWVIAAAVALYAGGMVLNDAYDLDLDRLERPERPLPRGAIARDAAFAAGGLLLAGGAAAACGGAWTAGTPWPAAAAAALVAVIWSYDALLKPTLFGPVAMGACRGLAWLLGLTAGGGPHGWQWLLPLGMGTYVAGITLFARHEATAAGDEAPPAGTGGAEVAAVRIGAAVMAAGLALASGPVWRRFATGARLPGTPLDAGTWLILWSIIAASILARALPAVVAPAPARIRPAVGNAILSIITLDAILVLAECGERWALAILALLIPAVVGRRIVPPT